MEDDATGNKTKAREVNQINNKESEIVAKEEEVGRTEVCERKNKSRSEIPEKDHDTTEHLLYALHGNLGETLLFQLRICLDTRL